MSVIDQLRSKSLELRKQRSSIAPAIQFALSEIDKIGKNNGNRATTDDEAIKVIQKLIAVIDENIKLAVNDGRLITLRHERNILESVLPKMTSDAEVRSFLATLNNPSNKGVVMRALKDEFGALIDMKQAGQIVTEVYSF